MTANAKPKAPNASTTEPRFEPVKPGRSTYKKEKGRVHLTMDLSEDEYVELQRIMLPYRNRSKIGVMLWQDGTLRPFGDSYGAKL